MAKAVGLDAGEHEIRLVELEGSYRRTRLNKIAIERVEPTDPEVEADQPDDRKAEAVVLAFKGAHAGRENVTLGFPSREAVFRTLMIPFTGREQIRKVIKFEVEGSIHSHSVDDMVVDFHTVGEEDGESEVIVAAAPKPALRMTLEALGRHGIEPEVVDLNAMALYRVADWYGAFSDRAVEDTGDDEKDSGGVEAVVPVISAVTAASEAVRVVLDIGARSTQVLLVVKGVLVDVRTLRSGESTVLEELSRSRGLSESEARRALGHTSAADLDEPDDVEVDEYVVRDDDEEEPPVLPEPVPQAVINAAMAAFLDRFRRELIRFLASVKQTGPIESVWVTGGGSHLPGMDAMLQEVFGCAPRWLHVLERLNHNLEEEQVRELEPRIAVAVGLALGAMGGPAGFNFRQEDLAFTRGFDRVKFPLAITCMVALFLVVVFGVKSWRELQWMEYKYGQTYSGQEGRAGRNLPMFQGYLAYLLNPPGSWFAQITNFESNEYRNLLTAVDATPVFGDPPRPPRLEVIRAQLRRYLDNARRETGVYSDLSVESGFAVLVRWAAVLDSLGDRLGRFLIMDVELNVPYNPTSRQLKFTIALRGDDFRAKHSELVGALEQECERTDSPFSKLTDPGREDIFVNPEQRGSYYTLTLGIRETFEPFVPGAE